MARIAAHALQSDDDRRRPVVIGRRAAAQAGVAALRQHARTGLGTQLHDGRDLLGAGGQHDAERLAAIAAAPILEERRRICGGRQNAFLTDDFVSSSTSVMERSLSAHFRLIALRLL